MPMRYINQAGKNPGKGANYPIDRDTRLRSSDSYTDDHYIEETKDANTKSMDDNQLKLSTMMEKMATYEKKMAVLEKLITSEDPHKKVINELENDDHDVKDKLFTESTHSFLFMDKIELKNGKEINIRLIDKFVALAVIICQMLTYLYIGYCIKDAHTASYNDGLEPQLEIFSNYCYNNTQYPEAWDAYRAEEYDNKEVFFGSLADAGLTAEDLPKVLQCGNPLGEVKGINNENGFDLDAVTNVTATFAVVLVFVFILQGKSLEYRR